MLDRSVGECRGLTARALWAVCLSLAAWASPGLGTPPTPEDPALARAYGSGVHAYFCGDFQRAYDDLTQAIEAGTSDPRAFYFRGLAARKLGRLDESEADFASAAEREADGTGAWPVSRSLERVQGCDRLALERYRTRARVVAAQRNQAAIEQRYSGLLSREPEVLRVQRPEGVELDVDAAADFLDAETVIKPEPAARDVEVERDIEVERDAEPAVEREIEAEAAEQVPE